MTAVLRPAVRIGLALALALVAVLVPAVQVHAVPADVTAREAIVRAVVERMGEGVAVEVLTVDLPAGAPALKSKRLDIVTNPKVVDR